MLLKSHRHSKCVFFRSLKKTGHGKQIKFLKIWKLNTLVRKSCYATLYAYKCSQIYSIFSSYDIRSIYTIIKSASLPSETLLQDDAAEIMSSMSQPNACNWFHSIVQLPVKCIWWGCFLNIMTILYVIREYCMLPII